MPQSRKSATKPAEEPQNPPVEQPALDERDAEPTDAERAQSEAENAEPIEGEVQEVEEGPLAGWQLPAGADLVALDETDAYRAMDRADEAQILAEIEGRALDVMLYSFKDGNKELTDLSYAGVRECVRTLNQRGLTRIEVAADIPPAVDEITEDGQAYIRVAVYARDVRNGGGQWGTAVEPKRMKLKAETARKYRAASRPIDADDRVWDKFALTKAMNKAQRNAMKTLIPLELQQTLIALLKKDSSRVQRIHAGQMPDQITQLPPPATGEEADKLREAARELLLEIRAIHPTAYMNPGQFNALLVRHEHSVERLHDFIQQLQQLRDRAKQETQETAETAAK